MRKLWLAFLLCLVACVATRSILAYQPQPSPAAHHISMTALNEETHCGSTAVGSHTLISAAHCVMGTAQITIDNTDKRNIQKMVYDEHDHVLITVDGEPFSTYLPIDQFTPKVGDHADVWGWPGESKKPIHRDAYFINEEPWHNFPTWNWELLAVPGDSGSGLIINGKIVAVASIADVNGETGTFPFAFTPTQLAEIK